MFGDEGSFIVEHSSNLSKLLLEYQPRLAFFENDSNTLENKNLKNCSHLSTFEKDIFLVLWIDPGQYKLIRSEENQIRRCKAIHFQFVHFLIVVRRLCIDDQDSLFSRLVVSIGHKDQPLFSV